MSLKDSNLYKWYAPLPPMAKGVVVVGGLVALYITGTTVYSMLFPSAAAQSAAQQQAAVAARVAQVGNDLATDISNGQTPSFDQTQYNNWADSIAAAFSGCDITSASSWLFVTTWNLSDSAQTVYNIVNQLNNDVDFLSLQKAFGTRTISKSILCGGDYNNVDLNAAVTNQLNTMEITLINNALTTKGITHKF